MVQGRGGFDIVDGVARIIVPARTGADATTVFLVDPAAAGVTLVTNESANLEPLTSVRLDGVRVGARHDDEIGIGLGIDGGLDAVDHFAGGHHFLARAMAAALGADLVFHVYGSHFGLGLPGVWIAYAAAVWAVAAVNHNQASAGRYLLLAFPIFVAFALAGAEGGENFVEGLALHAANGPGGQAELALAVLVEVAHRLNQLGHLNWRGDSFTHKKVRLVRITYGLKSRFQRLRERGMLDCLKLVHCHPGSQLQDIRRVKDAVNELAHVYAEGYHRPEMAIVELEQLICRPHQPAKQVVHWLHQIADIQIAPHTAGWHDRVQAAFSQRIADDGHMVARPQLKRRVGSASGTQASRQ